MGFSTSVHLAMPSLTSRVLKLNKLKRLKAIRKAPAADGAHLAFFHSVIRSRSYKRPTVWANKMKKTGMTAAMKRLAPPTCSQASAQVLFAPLFVDPGEGGCGRQGGGRRIHAQQHAEAEKRVHPG